MQQTMMFQKGIQLGSNHFLKQLGRPIWDYISQDHQLAPLCIGVTFDLFHAIGTNPTSSDLLYKNDSGTAISSATFCKNNDDIPSGPVDFLTFKFLSNKASSETSIRLNLNMFPGAVTD